MRKSQFLEMEMANIKSCMGKNSQPSDLRVKITAFFYLVITKDCLSSSLTMKKVFFLTWPILSLTLLPWGLAGNLSIEVTSAVRLGGAECTYIYINNWSRNKKTYKDFRYLSLLLSSSKDETEEEFKKTEQKTWWESSTQINEIHDVTFPFGARNSGKNEPWGVEGRRVSIYFKRIFVAMDKFSRLLQKSKVFHFELQQNFHLLHWGGVGLLAKYSRDLIIFQNRIKYFHSYLKLEKHSTY